MFVFIQLKMKNQEELRLFVKKKLRRGYPEGELRNDLLGEGYSAEEIQKAIYDPEVIPGNRKREGNNYPLWFAASVGFVILGLSLLSVNFIWLSKYGWFFLTIGLVGIAFKFLLPKK
jgi:hypothetical protein